MSTQIPASPQFSHASHNSPFLDDNYRLYMQFSPRQATSHAVQPRPMRLIRPIDLT
ncbi:uncharacterized protein K460DRAFT_164946 [Cucurbitaria berberidis CBS 394.84]|uniref:Uncharacterized protein n=1 Tax=Cucurbitaria berberidis CBS 394.84 TaxID=1168544 RepID=A0A9P4G9G1_9PLEO|nr:uncharacterized protein K460DRAFT_164946 [Cucurbitaria berberidis CBS 394.84]KAF1841316.1 hypothetical protein K460DRAFT_164946 [Cucurbitaria berberidis CBS 394.84]